MAIGKLCERIGRGHSNAVASASKRQLPVPTPSGILPLPPYFTAYVCSHKSYIEAGQVFILGPYGSHVVADDTVPLPGTGYASL